MKKSVKKERHSIVSAENPDKEWDSEIVSAEQQRRQLETTLRRLNYSEEEIIIFIKRWKNEQIEEKENNS